MTCSRDGWLSANTVRTSISLSCTMVSDGLFCRDRGSARCVESFCNWAKAICIPRVCSISAVSATRERTMLSSPRQPSTATNPSTLMATSSSTRVKPRCRPAPPPAPGALRIRHHLGQLDDAPRRILFVAGILCVKDAYLDAAEVRVWRGEYVFFARQQQLAVRT